MANDYDKIVEKIKSFGGIMCLTFDNGNDEFEANTSVDCWDLHGEAVIAMIHEDGVYGLYHFVGKSGDPVEKDIEFLEKLAKKNQCVCGHGYNNHFNAGERNFCAGGERVNDELGCSCEDFQHKNTLAEQFEFADRHGE